MIGRRILLAAVAIPLLLCVIAITAVRALIPQLLEDDPTPTSVSSANVEAPRATSTPVQLVSDAVENLPRLATPPPGDRPTMDPVEVVEAVGPAVVTVVNERAVGQGLVGEAGRGTGFAIAEDGSIVTNAHVVAGGDQFEVIFADGEKRPADLVGADPVSDLAVVRVRGGVPATVVLGNSDIVQPGQPVLAIGSPLGTFTNTVTKGIVSATGRDFPNGLPGSGVYTDLVQHDAAINPGNSGGPLLNLSGEVIGVNTLGIPVSEGGDPVQGLFFAVPSNTVRQIVDHLIEEGEVVYPYFGVRYTPVTEEIEAQFDLTVSEGVVVTEVIPGDPAADAGIQAGDVVLAIDGEQVDARNSFQEVLFDHEPGETVETTVDRRGERFQARVTLGTKPPA